MQSVNRVLVVAACFGVLFGLSTAPSADSGAVAVEVDVVIQSPQVDKPMELEITFYEIQWDVEKGENVPTKPLSQIVRYDPANPTPTISASYKLGSGVMYQLMVEGIDEQGNPWPGHTYYYDGSLFSTSAEPRFEIKPGSANRLQLPLVKGQRDKNRGNFLDVFMAEDAAQLALFVQPDLVSDYLYGQSL